MTRLQSSHTPLAQWPGDSAVFSLRPAVRSPLRWLPPSLGAFTIVELMISVAILGIISVASLLALSSDNRIAAVNRNLLSAKTLAQSRVDEALSVAYRTTSPVPAVLATGTVTTPVVISNNAPPLTGTMTTTVVVSDATLGLRRITVGVDYMFAGRPYNVTLATARAPD